MKKFILALLVLSAAPAYSWDGDKSGIIGLIQVTDPGNFGFRVSLKGYAPLCGNDHNWAYLAKDLPNYQVYVSALLAAKYSQSTVRIYTTKDAAGYCQIGYILVD